MLAPFLYALWVVQYMLNAALCNHGGENKWVFCFCMPLYALENGGISECYTGLFNIKVTLISYNRNGS